MCSSSSVGGSGPCRFHTTMGTVQISHSAIQHTPSSWYQGVMRAASHNSHSGSCTMAADPNLHRMTTWREPARDLHVIGEPDVLVVGAGSAGVAAALAAARRGAETWLVEATSFVGGLATLGLINLLLTLDDGDGHQVVAGLCQEFVDRLDARGAARFPASGEWNREDAGAVEQWRRWGLIWGAPPEAVRYSVAFDPEQFVEVSYRALQEA